MNSNTKDSLSQLDELLGSNHQAWLFGAGISFNAGIPLMGPLTDRVFKCAAESGFENYPIALDHIRSQLSEGCHIEHILSHIGDLRAIAERSKIQTLSFGEVTFSLKESDQFHQQILLWVAETVRWGYCAPHGKEIEKIGTRGNRIVSVDDHCRFVSALFSDRQKGLSERRSAVQLFTTNYDTLLEDALALSCLPYWDGFTGGAVAFRSYRYGGQEPDSKYRAHVVKLHGSIDWHLCNEGKIWRIRDGDVYPTKTSRVLIYPQSTKYLATQRDPLQHSLTGYVGLWPPMKKTCSQPVDTVSATSTSTRKSRCRWSVRGTKPRFWHFHKSSTKRWRSGENHRGKRRLYIISEAGLYIGDQGPLAAPINGKPLDWWTFHGVTQMLTNGPEASIL